MEWERKGFVTPIIPSHCKIIIHQNSVVITGECSFFENCLTYSILCFQLDRMAADCAIELWRHRVAMVSLWPGAVQTENIMDMVNGKGINKRIPNAERVNCQVEEK